MLTIDDLQVVYEKLSSVSPKWFNFGLALGLDWATLTNLTDKHHCDNVRCLREMLATRLQSSEPLNWAILCTCLQNHTVGFGALADTLKSG